MGKMYAGLLPGGVVCLVLVVFVDWRALHGMMMVVHFIHTASCFGWFKTSGKFRDWWADNTIMCY